jgi:hypothetical protein
MGREGSERITVLFPALLVRVAIVASLVASSSPLLA